MTALPSQPYKDADGALAPAGRLDSDELSRVVELSAAEAATLMGCAKRTVLLRAARGEYGGKARQDGDGRWWLATDATPALAIATGQVQTPVASTDSLAHLTAAQRETIAWRVEAVRQWQAALAHRPASRTKAQYTDDWCEVWRQRHPQWSVSRPTLYRWARQLDQGGAAALADDRRRRRRPGQQAACSPEAWALMVGLWSNANKPSIPRLYEQVAAQAEIHGWDWPALRTVQAWVRKHIQPQLATLGRDPKRYRDRCLPTVTRDWSQVPAGACWVADHRQVDVLLPMATWDAARRRETWRWYRPWVTMFLDARTWQPMGWSVAFDTPNSDRVMGTFIQAVRSHGLPEVLYLDNGKDFRAQRFAGGRKGRKGSKGRKAVAQANVAPVLETLGVHPVWALPYNARAKVVEPWFRLMSEWFDKRWPTYCGREPGQRPEAVREMFRTHKHAAQQMAEAGYTLDAFRQAFTAWITDDYSRRESPSAACCKQWPGGHIERLSPARGLAELRERAPVRPADEELALLLMPSVPVRVEPQGVYVRAFGAYYDAEALGGRRCGSGRDLVRKVRYRYDANDSDRVWLFDAQTDSYLCEARPFAGGGLNPLAAVNGSEAERQTLSDALARQRRTAKRDKAVVTALRRYAGNVLLASQDDAGRRLGRHQQLPQRADMPQVIKRLPGGIEQAADAMRAGGTRAPADSDTYIRGAGEQTARRQRLGREYTDDLVEHLGAEEYPTTEQADGPRVTDWDDLLDTDDALATDGPDREDGHDELDAIDPDDAPAGGE